MHSSVRFVYAVLAVVMASVATAWAASVPPPAMHAKDAARALATRALLSLPASVVPPAVDASADGIQINVTRHVDCTYKSRTGDAVFVNYNVTLANGTKVDSSKWGGTRGAGSKNDFPGGGRLTASAP